MNRRAVLFGGLSLAAFVALFALLNGPALDIDAPANAASVCQPIAVQLSWRGRIDATSLKVELKRGSSAATNVTSAFMIAPGASSTTGSVTAVPGSSTLTASAAIAPRFGQFTVASTITATRSFSVAAQALTLTPASATVAQGASQTVSIERSCLNPAMPLAVKLESDAELVAKPAVTPVTIGAGMTTASASIGAGGRPGTARITATVPSNTSVPAVTLTLKVPHKVGAFTRLNPSFVTPGGQTDSGNGKFTVHVSTARPNHTPPPLAWFDVSFTRKNTNTTLGGSVQMAQDTLGGGAGFCNAASTIGAVFSGYPVGHVSDYLFTLIDLEGSNPRLEEFEASSKVGASGTGSPLFFRPTLMFSPDCTLAIVAGANPTGGPEPHWLRLIDVMTGNGLPQGELGFWGLDDSSDLTAQLVNAGTNQQKVEISVGGIVVQRINVPQ